ncbi:MAG: LapA family protein [bacterium]
MKNYKLIALAVLVVLMVILIIQNSQVISIRLFFWKISMSQIILLLLTAVAGFGGGFITAKITEEKSS